MTNAELIQKIRSEIERRIETYKKGYANGDDCRADALEVLLHDLSFLGTIEKECQWSAEDETKIAYICDVMSGNELVSDISPSYRSEIIEFAKSLQPTKVKSGKPMNQEKFSKEFDEYFLPKNREQKGRWGFADIFSLARHFAKWGADHTPLPEDTVLFNKGVEEGKRLMMEEAVEGTVYGTENYKWVESNILGNIGEKGDKVRIIILPKED